MGAETTPRSLTTPERLIRAAALSFRSKGYGGAGLSEILREAGLPKGSLYHHFPGGKEDLALACADVGSKLFLRLLDRAFAGAETLEMGARALGSELEEAYRRYGEWRGCPITSTLVDQGGPPRFALRAQSIFGDWEAAFAGHYARLGVDQPARLARDSLVVLQGTWAQARATDDAARMRDVGPMLMALAAAGPRNE